MQRLEVSCAVRHIYIYVVSRLRVKNGRSCTSIVIYALMACVGTTLRSSLYFHESLNFQRVPNALRRVILHVVLL
jgi:hypothetical protein